jgi:ATP-dependent DNA ligase
VPRRLDSIHAALYLACRHVVASACPAGGLRRAVPPHQRSASPSGDQWLHEIKHDGFRVIARKEGKRVKLYSRPGLEGIVSKRRDSHYRSGRSPDWIKSKNPAAPAVRREAEEYWTR